MIEGEGAPRKLRLAMARAKATLVELANGRVAIVGGYTVTMDFSWEDVHHGSAIVELLDVARGTIRVAATLAVPRYGAGVIELTPGRLLVVGGRDASLIASIEIVGV